MPTFLVSQKLICQYQETYSQQAVYFPYTWQTTVISVRLPS
jgi:hypothetical protein